MLASFLLSAVVGCWAWSALIPHQHEDGIPSPAQLCLSMRLITLVDVAVLSLLFASYSSRAIAAVLAWLLVRLGGIFALHRYGWYWLADWISFMGRGG